MHIYEKLHVARTEAAAKYLRFDARSAPERGANKDSTG